MHDQKLQVEIDDLSSSEIAQFLEDHITEMKSVSPPESKHALDLESLKARDITFWSVHRDGKLVGCGALKELNPEEGEIKSMRSSPESRGAGVGKFILSYIVDEAKKRGYCKVSLETGSMPFFLPARSLYEKFGFRQCEPFGNYMFDPNSVFYAYLLDDT